MLVSLEGTHAGRQYNTKCEHVLKTCHENFKSMTFTMITKKFSYYNYLIIRVLSLIKIVPYPKLKHYKRVPYSKNRNLVCLDYKFTPSK